MRIGIAGTGKMGAAIALRLIELGHSLMVWNRTTAKLQPLLAAGAARAETPAELVAVSDAVICVLTNSAAQQAVYSGHDGLLAGDRVAGKLLIDMSTVQPHEMVALAADVRRAGGRFVEAPVGGTTGPARQGKLLGLVGGEAADVAAARPLLDQLCRRVEHLGAVGAGSAVKLAINLPLLVAYQALGEAYLLCRDIGLSPATLFELFADTSGAPTILKTRGPIIAAAIAGDGHAPPAFDIDSIRKDLRTMLAEATRLGRTLPVAERALSVFDQAAADGWGGRDGTSLPAYWVTTTQK